MRKTLFTLLMLFGVSLMQAADFNPKAQWITASEGEVNKPGTWLAFRQDVRITGKVPAEVLTSIAADSKYWLWVNGHQVVFEGSLKRGPTPQDSYFDQVDLAPYLKKGKYSIRITEDVNNNSMIDTGDLLLRKMPENVNFFKMEDGQEFIDIPEAVEVTQSINVQELIKQ